jgi:signal transduction histidine kinase
MRFDPQPVAVAPALRQVAAQVEPMVDVRELHLQLIAPPDIFARADQRHLVQVLYNLLSNAIKHSPRGGTITLAAARAGEKVRISVQDEGPGIPPEDQARIFLEFVTLESGAEGTGLGLALSRKLAELMGGELCVASDVGIGSTFTLTLPAVNPEVLPEGGDTE